MSRIRYSVLAVIFIAFFLAYVPAGRCDDSPFALSKQPPVETLESSRPAVDTNSGATVTLKMGEACLLDHGDKISKLSCADSGICDVTDSGGKIKIVGKFTGTTTVVLEKNDGSRSYLIVNVQSPFEAVKQNSSRPRMHVISSSAGDRVILTGDVDTPEAMIRMFTAGNTSVDDRGMTIQDANNRLISP